MRNSRLNPSVLLLAALALAACSREPTPEASTSPAPTETAPAAAAVVAPIGDPVTGLRVATRVGCNGCHGSNAAGRVFMDKPDAGRIVAPNLTQRRELYDDAGLEALLRQGKTHDGHVPVGMPIKMFQHLSDQDVRDITAWLRALPATANPELPEGKWSAELEKSVRDGTFIYMDDMQPDAGHVPPVTTPIEPLALGRHIAYTSCSECHAWDLNGWEGDDAPSLAVAKAYDYAKFERLMRTGITATGERSKTGMMSDIAVSRFSGLTDAELSALKQYLDSR